jgi:hypothetical protein
VETGKGRTKKVKGEVGSIRKGRGKGSGGSEKRKWKGALGSERENRMGGSNKIASKSIGNNKLTKLLPNLKLFY